MPTGRDVSMKTRPNHTPPQNPRPDHIGTLAVGVANDFNNILTVIIGACSLLEMNAADNPEQMESVNRIRSYAERAAQITRNLMEFSCNRPFVPKPENLNAVLGDMFGFLARIIGSHIRLETRLPERELTVLLDRRQLEQVFVQLASNFREAMPSGGVLSVELSAPDSAGGLDEGDGCPPGEYALITIGGTGPGIRRDEQPPILDPSFTTGGQVAHNGLGLAIVYGVISQHDGIIRVQNEPGGGTSFRIYLPLCRREGQNLHAPDSVTPPGGTETLLLVSGDPVMLNINRSLLEGVGYLVLSASDGREALELFRRGAMLISLAILDSGGEELDRELFERLRAQAGHLAVLFVRDSAGGLSTRSGDRRAAAITKPFDPLQLLEYIRALLDGRSP